MGLFVGISVRSTLFSLLIVLKWKEWLNDVHVIFVFCLGCCFKFDLSSLECRSAIFSLLIMLKCKEWLNDVHVIFVFCLGCCFKLDLSSLECRGSCTSIFCNLLLSFPQ
jgi:hypothetical protein